VLVYSTCTQEPAENEAIVSFLLEQREGAKLMPIDLMLNRSPALKEFEGELFAKEISHCLRIYPQDNNGEGFFVAKIIKTK
jgi:tRNA (cytosine49-C5)-methyltransferase